MDRSSCPVKFCEIGFLKKIPQIHKKWDLEQAWDLNLY